MDGMVTDTRIDLDCPGLPGGRFSCMMVNGPDGTPVFFVSVVGSLAAQERLIDGAGNPVAASGLDRESMRSLRDWLDDRLSGRVTAGLV